MEQLLFNTSQHMQTIHGVHCPFTRTRSNVLNNVVYQKDLVEFPTTHMVVVVMEHVKAFKATNEVRKRTK